ncbi:hypothetical protein DFQ26_008525 [Actinomortierella ambigua]|nr:hypothetical protein DFQ26_008525 [Actinomortierella ambigua]
MPTPSSLARQGHRPTGLPGGDGHLRERVEDSDFEDDGSDEGDYTSESYYDSDEDGEEDEEDSDSDSGDAAVSPRVITSNGTLKIAPSPAERSAQETSQLSQPFRLDQAGSPVAPTAVSRPHTPTLSPSLPPAILHTREQPTPEVVQRAAQVADRCSNGVPPTQLNNSSSSSSSSQHRAYVPVLTHEQQQQQVLLRQQQQQRLAQHQLQNHQHQAQNLHAALLQQQQQQQLQHTQAHIMPTVPGSALAPHLPPAPSVTTCSRPPLPPMSKPADLSVHQPSRASVAQEAERITSIVDMTGTVGQDTKGTQATTDPVQSQTGHIVPSGLSGQGSAQQHRPHHIQRQQQEQEQPLPGNSPLPLQPNTPHSQQKQQQQQQQSQPSPHQPSQKASDSPVNQTPSTYVTHRVLPRELTHPHDANGLQSTPTQTLRGDKAHQEHDEDEEEDDYDDEEDEDYSYSEDYDDDEEDEYDEDESDEEGESFNAKGDRQHFATHNGYYRHSRLDVQKRAINKQVVRRSSLSALLGKSSTQQNPRRLPLAGIWTDPGAPGVVQDGIQNGTVGAQRISTNRASVEGSTLDERTVNQPQPPAIHFPAFVTGPRLAETATGRLMVAPASVEAVVVKENTQGSNRPRRTDSGVEVKLSPLCKPVRQTSQLAGDGGSGSAGADSVHSGGDSGNVGGSGKSVAATGTSPVRPVNPTMAYMALPPAADGTLMPVLRIQERRLRAKSEGDAPERRLIEATLSTGAMATTAAYPNANAKTTTTSTSASATNTSLRHMVPAPVNGSVRPRKPLRSSLSCQTLPRAARKSGRKHVSWHHSLFPTERVLRIKPSKPSLGNVSVLPTEGILSQLPSIPVMSDHVKEFHQSIRSLRTLSRIEIAKMSYKQQGRLELTSTVPIAKSPIPSSPWWDPTRWLKGPVQINKSHWKPDNSRKTCAYCFAPFNRWTNPRHHCRKCGDLFCSQCASAEILMDAKNCVYVQQSQLARWSRRVDLQRTASWVDTLPPTHPVRTAIETGMLDANGTMASQHHHHHSHLGFGGSGSSQGGAFGRKGSLQFGTGGTKKPRLSIFGLFAANGGVGGGGDEEGSAQLSSGAIATGGGAAAAVGSTAAIIAAGSGDGVGWQSGSRRGSLDLSNGGGGLMHEHYHHHQLPKGRLGSAALTWNAGRRSSTSSLLLRSSVMGGTALVASGSAGGNVSSSSSGSGSGGEGSGIGGAGGSGNGSGSGSSSTIPSLAMSRRMSSGGLGEICLARICVGCERELLKVPRKSQQASTLRHTPSQRRHPQEPFRSVGHEKGQELSRQHQQHLQHQHQHHQHQQQQHHHLHQQHHHHTHQQQQQQQQQQQHHQHAVRRHSPLGQYESTMRSNGVIYSSGSQDRTLEPSHGYFDHEAVGPCGERRQEHGATVVFQQQVSNEQYHYHQQQPQQQPKPQQQEQQQQQQQQKPLYHHTQYQQQCSQQPQRTVQPMPPQNITFASDINPRAGGNGGGNGVHVGGVGEQRAVCGDGHNGGGRSPPHRICNSKQQQKHAETETSCSVGHACSVQGFAMPDAWGPGMELGCTRAEEPL